MEPDRRTTDRRQEARRGAEREGAARRKRDRRSRAARVGLLAAMTIAGALPRADVPKSTPSGLVQVAPPESPTTTEDKGIAAIEDLIQEASAAYNVNADLIRAIIQTESRFNPRAVSPVGAQGLMQLMPVTAKYLGVSDPFDPRQNIFAGVKYLSKLLDRFNGNVALTAAAYNAGPNAVARYRGIPPYKETRGYVKKVKGYMASGVEIARSDVATAD